MGTATSAAIEIGDLHNAYPFALLRRPAEPEAPDLVGGIYPRRHPPPLHDDLVAEILYLGHLFSIQPGQVQVDRAIELPQVEGHRICAQNPLESSRQDVLTGVLLHMVITAFPTDNAFDTPNGQWAIEIVDDLPVALDHLDDVRLAKGTRIVRLTTRRRIKASCIEDNGGTSTLRAGLDNIGSETTTIRGFPIQTTRLQYAITSKLTTPDYSTCIWLRPLERGCGLAPVFSDSIISDV